MQKQNYKKIYAIKRENEKRVLRVCPSCPNTSGIYFFLRKEDDFKYAYIGQAKHLLDRIASHLSGYQHIDLSIKKHGLWSEDNPCGYEINYLEFPESVLDDQEQYFIKKYANAGWQLRNVESGGKQGKTTINERRPAKTYYDGIEQGEKNARKMVAHLFDLHLDYIPKKNPPTKNQQKAMLKFKDFLDLE